MGSLINEIPAAAIGAFIGLILSDHYLTLYAARLYKKGANRLMVLEGSYELNPKFAGDVDQLRGINPRFMGLIVTFCIVIWGIWFLTVRLLAAPWVFELAVGAVLLVQGPIHIRHVRNIVVFGRMAQRDGVGGRIEYSRRFNYIVSAVDMASFAALYLTLAMLTSSWLLGGGAVGCAAQALGHYRLSRRLGTEAPVL